MANYSNIPIPIVTKVIDEETHKMIGSENVLNNKRVDLQIFGFFQVNSLLIDGKWYDDNGELIDTKIRYIPKKGNTQEQLFNKFKKYLEEYNAKVEKEEYKVKICSYSTFRSRFKELKMFQMIVETTIDIGGVATKVYKIQTQFNIFQYVPKPTMEQLAYGTNSATIKVYGYLLNKYKMAKERGEDTEFSAIELLRMLGMSDTYGDNYKHIRAILYTLHIYGLLDYCCWVEKKDGEIIQKKRVLNMEVDLKPMGYAVFRA